MDRGTLEGRVMISLDELQAELKKLGVDAHQQDPAARTAKEWKEEWKCGLDAARKLLSLAKKHDLVEVSRKQQVRLDDKAGSVPVYRFKNKPTKKRKRR